MIFDILVREGDSVYAVRLPLEDGENKAVLKDVDSGDLFVSPLSWSEAEEGRKIRVRVKEEVEVERTPSYDVIKFKDKKYVGKFLAEPWTLEGIVYVFDMPSEGVFAIDLTEGKAEQVLESVAKVYAFKSNKCGFVHTFPLLGVREGKTYLFRVSAEGVETLTHVRGKPLGSHDTTHWFLGLSAKQEALFVNCLGDVTAVHEGPLIIREAMLYDEKLVLLIVHSAPNLDFGSYGHVVIVFGRQIHYPYVQRKSLKLNKGGIDPDSVTLVDVNLEYTALATVDRLLIFDNEWEVVDELPFDANLPEEVLFHPRRSQTLVLLERGEPVTVDLP